MESFMAYQREAEERFEKREGEKWEKEQELEERRRKEEHEHQMRMMQMLGQMFQHPRYYTPPFNPEQNHHTPFNSEQSHSSYDPDKRHFEF